MVAPTPTPASGPTATRRPRIAYLSHSSGAFDARSHRMARSAYEAGFDVTIYARLQDNLPRLEQRDGYRIVRTWWHAWLAFPVLRTIAWRRLRGAAARRAAEAAAAGVGADELMVSGGQFVPGARPAMPVGETRPTEDLPPPAAAPPPFPSRAWFRTWPARSAADLRRSWKLTKRLLMTFPIRPRGWAVALDELAEPADIWHGMWAGSLPALTRLARHHGGRTVYDSRDVYLESRDFAKAPRLLRPALAWVERQYAHRVDRVITVNESYADLLERSLRIARPPVVMNCSPRWTPPDPAPDLIRQALHLPAGTMIALYQGLLSSERGIEQAMDAILEVPEAVLVLLGFGKWQARLEAQVAEAPYAGRVFVLPPVPPEDLLLWTASADVSVMAIAPTTVNHRYTTPQKLFESLAAGVPVVASDLPGMAAIVRASGCGILVDPLSPSAIADGIRQVVTAPADERAAYRRRVLAAAHRDYSWEAQLDTLMALYRDLLPRT